MSDHAPSSEQQRPNEPTVNEHQVPQSSTSSSDTIGPSDGHLPPQNESTSEASDNTGVDENLEQPRAENNEQGLGARVRTLIDLSRDVMVELVGMLIMLNVGPQLAISDEQLVRTGFTPMTISPNAGDVLYMRHHGHQGRGSGADASVSGPYTREETVSETRASLLWRIRRASAMMAFFNANHGQPESSGESENSRIFDNSRFLEFQQPPHDATDGQQHYNQHFRLRFFAEPGYRYARPQAQHCDMH
ncbi:hypothetical protein BKA80DRAFT_254741 [Phyllosticta citrichinensis]